MATRHRSTGKRLTLRQWWNHVGTANVKLVEADIGTSLAYLRLISYRLKRPSYDFAKKLIEAATRLTPGFAPDLELMMEPLPVRVPGRPPVIPPSPEFQRSQRKAQGVAA